MQEKVIETRTFPEIWKDLSSDEKDRVRRQILIDGWASTPQTIWNWGTGKTAPRIFALRNGVANTMGKILGRKIAPQTLFPNA